MAVSHLRLVGPSTSQVPVEPAHVRATTILLDQNAIAISNSVRARVPVEMTEKEPYMVTTVNAQLPFLPEPLKLRHGPIQVTVETWSDGDVEARIPALALSGEGENDTLALGDLAEEILSFAVGVRELLDEGGVLAGPLLQQWNGLSELVDVTNLPK